MKKQKTLDCFVRQHIVTAHSRGTMVSTDAGEWLVRMLLEKCYMAVSRADMQQIRRMLRRKGADVIKLDITKVGQPRWANDTTVCVRRYKDGDDLPYEVEFAYPQIVGASPTLFTKKRWEGKPTHFDGTRWVFDDGSQNN